MADRRRTDPAGAGRTRPTLDGPVAAVCTVTTVCTASAPHPHPHPRATVVDDEPVAAEPKLADRYRFRHVYANKPESHGIWSDPVPREA